MQTDVGQPWHENKNGRGEYCYGAASEDGFCSFGDPSREERLLILGDSTIESLCPDLVPRLVQEGYFVTTMNSSACPFVPSFFLTEDGHVWDDRSYPCDVEYQRRRQEIINKNPGATIVLGGQTLSQLWQTGRFELKSEGAVSYQDAYVENVKLLLEHGHPMVHLGPLPRFPEHAGRAWITYLRQWRRRDPSLRELRPQDLLPVASMPISDFERSTADWFELFSRIKHGNLTFVEPHLIFCGSWLPDRCVSNDGRTLLFVDEQHPSRSGSRLINQMIVDAIKSMRQRP